jgi:hypothetical protein
MQSGSQSIEMKTFLILAKPWRDTDSAANLLHYAPFIKAARWYSSARFVIGKTDLYLNRLRRNLN